MNNLVPIGRFSQITRLSIRMLRHYDEVGLLKPAMVDPGSGYRYYSLSQVGEAERIRLLRSLEMPLEEIRELLMAQDARAIQERLEKHKNRLEGQIAQYQQVIAALENLEAHPLETYPVQVRQEAAQLVLTQRLRTSFEAMKQNFGVVFGELFATLNRQGLRPMGPPFVLYHSLEFNEDDLEYEPGIPSERLAVAPVGLSTYELPSSPVLYTLHPGPYDNIERAYQAVTAWMQEHGHEAAGSPREVYLVGKGQVENPAEYRTELVWPIRR